MKIIIDKRVELLAIIQTMSQYWDNLSLKYFNKKLFKCKYKEDVDKYFNKYKNNETVKLFGELCNDVQDFSTFINLVLCYSNPPNLDNIANIENNINNIDKQSIPYDKFINSIKRFYEETNFEYFFENNKNEYEKLINDYMNKNDLKEYVNIIDVYFGSNINNFTIAISSLLMGNFGVKILTYENITYNYSVISPFDYKENKYIFGSKFSVLELLWHEISHLTINDLTKNYFDQFDISCKIISDDFIKHFYTDIETIVNEYIIRAISIRLLEINYGEKTVENLVQDNIQKGFIEIESIKNYISKNCEKDNKFIKNGYKALMEFVINKI